MFTHIDIVAQFFVFSYFINTNEGAELTQGYCVLSAMKSTQNLGLCSSGTFLMRAGHQGNPVILAQTISPF